MTDEVVPVGAYVLATKFSDGDPGDAWAVGYYLGMSPSGRYLVGPLGGSSYRFSGYRNMRAGLREDVGKWLLENAQTLERSPPGTINLWSMLSDSAFEEAVTDTKQ